MKFFFPVIELLVKKLKIVYFQREILHQLEETSI
jgi:hypothetical protein